MKRGLTLCLLSSIAAFTQTRTAELLRLREEYQRQLAPERSTSAEELFRRVKDDKILERINYGYNGFGAKVGGLVTGGGFAVGPQYLRDDLKNGALVVRASAQASIREYYRVDGQLLLPKLMSGRTSFDLRASHRNYPGIPYYGPGPDSQKVRTNYRLEDSALDAALGFSPLPFLRVGGAAGVLAVNVGSGTDRRFVSTDTVFPAAQVLGLDNQSNFFRYGAFGQFDWRDNSLAPRNGGNYVVQYARYQDRSLRLHDFNMLDIDLQQYTGFLNRSRVIALRTRTRLTDRSGGQTVPFYLQPVIGGSDDLRGFRPFRFSGNNSVLFSGEYRWAIFSGCDGAVFADAGKVFDRRGQLNFSNLESSAGFGLRFNARNQTFMRFDVGFSHEGFQVWFKFTDVFQQRPLGTADSQPIN